MTVGRSAADQARRPVARSSAARPLPATRTRSPSSTGGSSPTIPDAVFQRTAPRGRRLGTVPSTSADDEPARPRPGRPSAPTARGPRRSPDRAPARCRPRVVTKRRRPSAASGALDGRSTGVVQRASRGKDGGPARAGRTPRRRRRRARTKDGDDERQAFTPARDYTSFGPGPTDPAGIIPAHARLHRMHATPSSSSISARNTPSSSRAGCASCRSIRRSCPPAHQAPRPCAAAQAPGDRALRRARQRPRQGRAALRPGLFDLGVPVLGSLLRHAAHEPPARRRGEAGRTARVRAGPASSREDGRFSRALALRRARLDEPRRLDRSSRPTGFRSWAEPAPTRSPPSRIARAPALRHPVPSRGRAHRRGHARPRATSSTSAAAGATGTRPPSSTSRSSRSASRWGEGRVICALSGGVDSAVAALLVHRAIGDRLTCVFVDNGLLRKDEAAQVRKRFAERLHLKVLFVDALAALPRASSRASPTPSASARSSAGSSSRSSRPRMKKVGQGRLPRPGHALPRRDRVHLGAGARRRSSRATTTWAGCPRR